MPWNFFNSLGELQINDGGVLASNAVFTGNADLGSNSLVGNGGGTGIAISANGEVTMAAQPAIFVRRGTAANNVTGAGTVYTMVFTTEIFDQNADYDATSTFTAPITGRYHVDVYLDIASMTSSANAFLLDVVMSNRSLSVNYGLTNGIATRYAGMISMLVDMDLDDELQVRLTVTGESGDVVDINSNTSLGIYLAA